ncbi:rCG24538 [Rattus norvegicus]|uniref:RCG24538 n=1 Tax=Rattus norvegicus TaxID=10116 RepID=A6JCJ1_RAT|nr:rCG24538 [Rattus norvegicus]
MPKENECYRLAGSVNQGGGPGCLGQKDSTLRIQAHVAAVQMRVGRSGQGEQYHPHSPGHPQQVVTQFSVYWEDR